jgi:hypothetical protein
MNVFYGYHGELRYKLGMPVFVFPEFDFEAALGWIEDNLLVNFETREMSWIVGPDDDDSDDVDQSVDLCPECAEARVNALIASGKYADGEVFVTTESYLEHDGCATCEDCGIALDCSSVGGVIDQELEHIQCYGWDWHCLYNLVEVRSCWDSERLSEEKQWATELLQQFFLSGEYLNYLTIYGE